MAVFPEPGLYRITSGPYAATILEGEDVLRGEPILGSTHQWYLDYVKIDSDGYAMCTLQDVEARGYLGVKSIETNQPVYRLEKGQDWCLVPSDDGFVISRLLEDMEYFWYLGGSDKQIIITDDVTEPQSWVFEKVG